MEKFLTIVVSLQGLLLGILGLINWKRTQQALEERKIAAEERHARVKAEVVAEKAKRALKKKINELRNEDMTDEEADAALDRLLGEDDG